MKRLLLTALLIAATPVLANPKCDQVLTMTNMAVEYKAAGYTQAQTSAMLSEYAKRNGRVSMMALPHAVEHAQSLYQDPKVTPQDLSRHIQIDCK